MEIRILDNTCASCRNDVYPVGTLTAKQTPGPNEIVWPCGHTVHVNCARDYDKIRPITDCFNCRQPVNREMIPPPPLWDRLVSSYQTGANNSPYVVSRGLDVIATNIVHLSITVLGAGLIGLVFGKAVNSNHVNYSTVAVAAGAIVGSWLGARARGVTGLKTAVVSSFIGILIYGNAPLDRHRQNYEDTNPFVDARHMFLFTVFTCFSIFLGMNFVGCTSIVGEKVGYVLGRFKPVRCLVGGANATAALTAHSLRTIGKCARTMVHR